MGILWKAVFTRFKGRPTDDELYQSALDFGKAGLRNTTLAPYLNALSQIDPSRDWIAEWESTLRTSISPLAQGQTRSEQAILCRRAILMQIDSCSISKHLLECNDEQIKTYWLSTHYVEHRDLNDQGKFNLLVIHRAFALLRLVSLSGLYIQQFNHDLNEKEFSEPYQRICEVFCEILLKSLLAKDAEILRSHPNVVLYVDVVANRFHEAFFEAKESFVEIAARGNCTEVRAACANLAPLFENYRRALDEFDSLRGASALPVAAPSLNR